MLTPSPMGEMVYEIVLMTMPSMLEPTMTASWEKGLSLLERGEITTEVYRRKLDEYVTKYVELVKQKDLSSEVARKLRTVTEVNKTGQKKEKQGKEKKE